MNSNRPQKKGKPFPLGIIALDAIGTGLVALGVAKLFVGVDVVPPEFQFEGYAPTLVGVGVALMVPFFVHIFRAFR